MALIHEVWVKNNQDPTWCRRAMELENFLVNYAANKEYAAELRGIEIGRKKIRRDIATRMLNNHYPDNEIMHFTQLTAEELEDLRKIVEK